MKFLSILLLSFALFARAESNVVGPAKELEKAFVEATKKAGVADAVLIVMRVGDREPVFKAEVGRLSSSTAIPIASGSKWVTAAVILALVEEGKLRLEDTVGTWMNRSPADGKWNGPKAKITVAQLLSMTSGLTAEPECLRSGAVALASCVKTISERPLSGEPGRIFEYGDSHLHVAGRIAEIATGQSWNQIFERVIRAPLGMSPDAKYYAGPKERSGDKVVRPSSGLVISPDDYMKFLRLIAGEGTFEGRKIFSESLSRRMNKNHLAGVQILDKGGMSDSMYGFGHWIRCPGKRAVCDEETAWHHSVGSFGSVPWHDREGRLTGIFATVGEENNARNIQPILRKLRLKIAALAKPKPK